MKKEGYKTTEFWLTLIGIIVETILKIKNFIPAEVYAKYMLILIIFYGFIRMIVKITPTKKDDIFIEKLNKEIEKIN
jgi:hypothetical protein